MDVFRERFTEPVFLVISDDPVWCKKNLKNQKEKINTNKRKLFRVKTLFKNRFPVQIGS